MGRTKVKPLLIDRLDALVGKILFAPDSSAEDLKNALNFLSRFAKSAHWARLGPHSLVRLIELPAFVAVCQSLHPESFSFDELLLAIQNLSVSDNNKPIIGIPFAVRFLFKFLSDKSATSRCLELAASTLIELSFHAEVKTLFADPSLQADAIVREAMDSATGAAKYNLTQLKWAVQVLPLHRALPCHAMPCPGLPCPALSYLALRSPPSKLPPALTLRVRVA